MTSRWTDLPGRIDALVAALNSINDQLAKVQREVAASKHFVRTTNTVLAGEVSRPLRWAGA